MTDRLRLTVVQPALDRLVISGTSQSVTVDRNTRGPQGPVGPVADDDSITLAMLAPEVTAAALGGATTGDVAAINDEIGPDPGEFAGTVPGTIWYAIYSLLVAIVNHASGVVKTYAKALWDRPLDQATIDTSPTTGGVVQYDGTKYVNGYLATSSLTSTVVSPAGDYVVLVSDDVVLVDTSVPRTIALPDLATARRPVTIKDRTGSGGTNTITIARDGAGDTIDGVAIDDRIETDFGATTFVPDGGGWRRIGSGHRVMRVYSAAGDHTWVCPPGRTRLEAWMRPGAAGGGKGGGGGYGFVGATAGGGAGGAGGSGGGGAQSIVVPPMTVVPGTSYTLTVGAGGAGGTSAGAGGTSGANATVGGVGANGAPSAILVGGVPIVRVHRNSGIGGTGGAGGNRGAAGAASGNAASGSGVAGGAGYPTPGIALTGIGATSGSGGNGGNASGGGGSGGSNGGSSTAASILQYATTLSGAIISGGNNGGGGAFTTNMGGGAGGGGGGAGGLGDELLVLGVAPSGGTGGNGATGTAGAATSTTPAAGSVGVAGTGGRGGGGGGGGAGSGGSSTTGATGGAGGNGGDGSPGQIVLIYTE